MLRDGNSQSDSKMRQPTIAICGVVALGALLCALSYCFLARDGSSFAGNLLLNVVAECLGFAGGAVVALWVAKYIAEKKLAEIAPHLVRVIRQLRADATISGRAAQECVSCAVHVLSEKPFCAGRDPDGVSQHAAPCGVCALKFEADPSVTDRIQCLRCGLPESIWSEQVLSDRPISKHVGLQRGEADPSAPNQTPAADR
jgi:hypothetical protein